MFETFVTQILNKYLSEFIEDVDTRNLNIGFDGIIELKNMQLKKTLFDDWPVPFKLEYGQVGRIYLKIPIWNLFNQPVVIQINDVFGFVKLINIPEFNSNVQKEAFRYATQQTLANFEILEQQKKELKLKSDDEKNQNSSYTSKLINNILQNIKIEITNIYFRFEDKMSGDLNEFSLGIQL